MIRPEDVELFRKGGEMVFDLREMQGSSKWDRVLVIEQLVSAHCLQCKVTAG